MNHLLLIDAPNALFRAFHGIRPLSNRSGMPTHALYGFVGMLRSAMLRLAPTHVAVIFDPKGGSFRNAIHADYKAHRPPMPDELAQQWPLAFELTRAFRLPLVQVANYEADDAIATLATEADAAGWRVTIVSTDKDLMQLVNERVHLLDTMREVEYDSAAVQAKWGVPPAQIHDLLALTGDSSDNIPGIPGIGPKTAAELLGQFGTLEGVLAAAESIKQPKRREALLTHRETARLAWQLVALARDTPIGLTLDDLARQEPDRAELARLYADLDFRRFADELAATAPSAPAPAAIPLENASRRDRLVDDEATLAELLAALDAAELIALDTETTSLSPHDAELVGLSFAVQPGEGWYLPLGHVAAGLLETAPKQLPKARVLEALRPILESGDKNKCGHNLKFDEQVLWRADIKLAGMTTDSLLLAYVAEPGSSVGLDAQAERHLHHRCTPFEELCGKGAKQITFDRVPIAQALPYASEDAEVALRLAGKLSADLGERVARHDAIELPLSRVLAAMEWRGAKVDRQLLASLSSEFGQRILDLEAQIHAEAGMSFNIASPRQLGELLFEKLALPGGKRTKSGQWATDSEVLEELAGLHAVPRLILESRQLAKLKSTYTDALQRLIHPKTGRVHTSFNQAVTTTGRLSSTEPNLQNIPIRTEEGRRIRRAFIAEPGNILIAADYSQIELRLMAHFSGDASLIAAFEAGHDIHAATAAAVAGIPIEQVSGEQRRRAKVVNFGILYGMSPFGLARELGIGRGEAAGFIEAWFARYPSVRGFIDDTLAAARRQGYVQTLLGHRVYLPQINERNANLRSYAERTAVNAPLQGSAADIIKVAMIRLHQRLADELPDASIILQVHDELVVECPEHQFAAAGELVRETMEQAAQLTVPLEVEVGPGKSWFEAHWL